MASNPVGSRQNWQNTEINRKTRKSRQNPVGFTGNRTQCQTVLSVLRGLTDVILIRGRFWQVLTEIHCFTGCLRGCYLDRFRGHCVKPPSNHYGACICCQTRISLKHGNVSKHGNVLKLVILTVLLNPYWFKGPFRLLKTTVLTVLEGVKRPFKRLGTSQNTEINSFTMSKRQKRQKRRFNPVLSWSNINIPLIRGKSNVTRYFTLAR